MGDKTSSPANFSLYSRLSLLSKATADNEEPIPGYMYQEIANISNEAGSSCQELLVFLIDQLSSRSCYVKIKVLKILLFVVKNGHLEFRQSLRKKSLCITDCIQFSGPPDPQHGMAWYHQVRKLAAELSEVLFSSAEEDNTFYQTQATHSPVKPVMAGMGSSPGIEGFGSSQIKSKTFSEELVSNVRDFAEMLLSPQHSIHLMKEDKNDKRFGEYEPASMNISITDTSPTSSTLASETSEEKPGDAFSTSHIRSIMSKSTARRHGVPGGGWADDTEEEDTTKQENITLSHDITKQDVNNQSHGSIKMDVNNLINRSHDSMHINNTMQLSQRLDSVKVEDFTTEETLVKDILLSKTESFFITHAELTEFTKSCSTLNCDYVLKVIDTYLLQSKGEVLQMRAMLLLESLLRTDYVQIGHVIKQCSPCLVTVCNSQCNQTNQKTKSKAKKILRILEKLSDTLILCEVHIPPITVR